MKIIRTFFVAIVLFLLTPNISFAALVSGMTSASQVYILNSIGYFNSIINANKSQYAPGETITLSGNINSTSVYGGDYLSMDMSIPPAAASSVFSLSPVTMGNSKTINKTMTAPATPGPFTIVVWVVERMTANLGEPSSITGTGYLNLNATLSASPTTCAIPLGQSFCNVSFTWNMGNSAYVQVPSLYNTTRATSYSSLVSGTISGAVTYGANTVVARTSPSATQFADMASIVVTGTCAGVWSGGFCVAPAVPTVTVGAASSITTTGATLVANVASLGTPAAISARGTCWGTTPAPTTNCLADGLLTTGVFSQIRTGLTQGTLYYFRGYATNATGTGYSADGTFTTTATAVPTVTSPVSSSVTTTTAILGANVTSLGNPATISSRGTCWGTTPAPTTNCLAQGLLTTGLFSQTRTGLTQGTLYYYRGYATNATGTGYSADGTFTTIATAVPTVTTPTSASITTTTATLGANVTSLGVPAAISVRGICWGTTPNPTLTDYATGAAPSTVAISADGTSVYVTNAGSNTVSMYSRNTSTGTLSAKTDYATGIAPYGVTISTDGISVYVANSTSNTVSMYSRNTSTGTLSVKTDYVTGGVQPYDVTISTDGTSVYAVNTNGASNIVSMYSRNTSTGTLSVKTDYVTGTSPYDVTVSPDGTSVYIANFSVNTVSMYTRNPLNGTLSAKTDYPTGVNPRAVIVSPGGTSVYVVNYTSNTVSMYTRNPLNGTLSAKTDYPTGVNPWGITSSSDGTSVYVTNYTSNTVSMYSRNTSTGTLSVKTDYVTGVTPWSVVVSVDGSSVYVANYGSATITTFNRSINDGTLSTTSSCPVAAGVTTGVFTQVVAGLVQGTLYYYRGYATNTTGTGYSADGTFMTVGIPDLTASVSTPTSATTGAAVTFSATVSNIGTASTGAGFSNFFQVATATNGGGTITGLTAVAVATLAAGANVVASSPSYTFPTAGTYSVRVCADKTSAASAGIITESNEGNNCGLWVDVVVVAPIKTVTLSPLSSSITLGQSITLSSTANFSTGNMTQHNIDWRKQGTTCWDWEVGCAVVASISPPNAAFAATGSHSISATFTPTQTGTYDIQAAAFDGSLPWTYAPSATTYATVTVAPAPIVPCTEAAVIAWGSCVSSATCTTPPDTMIVSGTRVGFCAAGTNPASVVGTCANAVITCTAPIVTTSCGNSICELAGTPPETIMSCPADCHAPVQQF